MGDIINVDSMDCIEDNFEKFVNGDLVGVIKLAVPVANKCELSRNLRVWQLFLGVNATTIDRILAYMDFVVESDNDCEGRRGEIVSAQYANMHSEVASFVSGADGLKVLYEEAVKKQNCRDRLAELRAKEREYMLQLSELDDKYTNEDGELDCEWSEDDTAKYDYIYGDLEELRDMINAVLYIGSEEYRNKLYITEIKLFTPFIRSCLESKGLDDKLPYAVYNDLKILYKRVVLRNVRIGRLIELTAPDIIMRNEKRMLQESVDSLLINNTYGNKYKHNRSEMGCGLTSLADIALFGADLV